MAKNEIIKIRAEIEHIDKKIKEAEEAARKKEKIGLIFKKDPNQRIAELKLMRDNAEIKLNSLLRKETEKPRLKKAA